MEAYNIRDKALTDARATIGTGELPATRMARESQLSRQLEYSYVSQLAEILVLDNHQSVGDICQTIGLLGVNHNRTAEVLTDLQRDGKIVIDGATGNITLREGYAAPRSDILLAKRIHQKVTALETIKTEVQELLSAGLDRKLGRTAVHQIE